MIPYTDLLALKFRLGGRDPATGIDCWWAWQEVARRHGRVVPDIEDILVAQSASLGQMSRALWAALEPAGIEKVCDGWRGGDPGDGILCGPLIHGAPCHVAPLLTRSPALCLQVTPGGVVACKPWLLANVLGTWRAPRACPSLVPSTPWSPLSGSGAASSI